MLNPGLNHGFITWDVARHERVTVMGRGRCECAGGEVLLWWDKRVDRWVCRSYLRPAWLT